MCSFDCVCGLVFFFFWLCSMVSALAPFRITGIVFDFCFFFFFSSFLSQFQRVLSFFFSSLFFFVSDASQSKICSLQLLSNFWFFLPLCKKRDKREKETKRNEKKTTTEEKRRNPRAQPTAEKKQWQCDERKKVETTWKLRGNQSGQRERRKCGPDDGVGGVWVYTQFRVCSLSLFFFFSVLLSSLCDGV